MLAIPLYLFFAGLTAWGFVSIEPAGWVFIGIVLLFTAWLLVVWSSLRNRRLGGHAEPFTPQEIEVFKRYALYFVYPYQARQYSSTMCFILLLCVIWGGLCVWRGQWTLLAAMVVLFFVANAMAEWLDHGNFLRTVQRQGKLTPELMARLAAVESVEEKILAMRR